MTVGVFSRAAVSLEIHKHIRKLCKKSGNGILTMLPVPVARTRILDLFLFFLADLSSLAPGAK